MAMPKDERTADTGQSATTERVLTAHAAARELGVHERTVRRAIARGQLPAIKRAGVFRISRAALARYRAESTATPRQPPPAALVVLHQGPVDNPFDVPRPRTPIFGREHEIRAVEDLLSREDVQLITLVGAGGIGKTRLALEVAMDMRNAFGDGAWFVDLSPIRDPELVLATIVRALEIREVTGQSATDRLRMFLESRRALLVLDNVEQVISTGPDIAGLLESCPKLTVLVTSRVPLHLSAEQRYPVPPLPIPDLMVPLSMPEVRASAAVQLFCRKAMTVHPDFALTDTNAQTVSAICARLEGLPLAIELAASRINVLSPAALLARLDRSLPLLADGPQDAPPRLRSMRDAIAWSYDLLDETSQRLFRRLAVFTGGCTEAAAAFVGQDEPDDESTPILHRLAALVEANLLVAADDGEGNPRFTMLETIREFGLEQQAANAESEAICALHAAWMLDLAQRAEPLWNTAKSGAALDMWEREDDNLRTALSWLAASSDRLGFVRLVGLASQLWSWTGLWREGRGWLEVALTWSAGTRTRERVNVLNGAVDIANDQSHDSEARAVAWGEESLAIAREIGDRDGEIRARFGLGITALSHGDFDRAKDLLEALLRIVRDAGDQPASGGIVEGHVIGVLGLVALNQGDDDTAERLVRESLAFRDPDPGGENTGVAACYLILAVLAYRRGERERAAALCLEGLPTATNLRSPEMILFLLDRLAIIAGEAAGQAERAAQLGGTVEYLHEVLGTTPNQDEQPDRVRARSAAGAAIGDAAFNRAWAAGRTLSREEALALAMQVEISPSPAVVPPGIARLGISPREHEVLCLLAEGRTDREIADALYLSRRTVNTHVSHLLAKLGVPNRRQAIAFARDEQLLTKCPNISIQP
jgi:non-specific serine/threonine protein kinase